MNFWTISGNIARNEKGGKNTKKNFEAEIAVSMMKKSVVL